MSTALTIAKQVERIIAYINPSQPQQEDIQQEILYTLQNMQRIFPRWVICTCRFMHKGFFYVSDNCRQMLGFSEDNIAEKMSPEVFFRRVHPADIDHFSHCVNLASGFMQETEQEELHLYRYVFQYRLQHADGRYLHVQDEKAMLRLKNGMALHYFLLRDISQENAFSGVRLTVFKDGMGEKKIMDYNAVCQLGNLTSREAEVIPLMRQGLSVKEIAWHLGISPNTVRNMRQRLFGKFQVNNAIELLNKADEQVFDMQSQREHDHEWRFASAV
jgi:DNA-binding CsgD family transcriptional regulator